MFKNSTFRSESALFWERCPALSLGISALIGVFCFLENSWWVALLWISYLFLLSLRQGLFHIAALLLFAIYPALLFYHPPPCEKEGNALFSIHSMHKNEAAFQTSWIYRGDLRAFENWSGVVPCTISYRGNSPPSADSDYLVRGRLKEQGAFNYTLGAEEWKRVEGSYSLAKLRFNAKEKVRNILKTHMTEQSASFLTALFTGDLDDRELRFAFSRIGLQHILAISGFHFAILASFAAFLLQLFLPRKICLYLLLGIAALYFLFIGNSPAVFRSYLACSIYFIGQLLQRKSSGINLLGGSLLLEIFFNPLSVRTIGFHLSFLACFGILLLHAPIRDLLKGYFKERSLLEASKLSSLEQGTYLFSSFFSRALYLNLAVNLALIPLLLFHFGRFPLLSLFYNLFAPSVAACCLFLLLLSLLAYAVFPLASLPLFALLDFITQEFLELLCNPPPPLDLSFFSSFPSWAVIFWIGLLLLVGIERTSAKPGY